MSLEEATGGYIMSLQNQVMGLRVDNSKLRRALCEYQLKFWTLSYQNTKFFGALLGDDEDWEDE